MAELILFIINPLLTLFYGILNLKKNKKRMVVFFTISLAIISTYIPYHAGDSVRYAFKYYELNCFSLKEAYVHYLPGSDFLFYNFLFLFSRLKLPYNFFLIFMNLIILFIIVKLLERINKLNISNIACLYLPATILLLVRFPLATYISIYALVILKGYKRYLLLLSCLYIHKFSIVLIILYLFVEKFYKIFQQIKIRKMCILIIILSNLIIKNVYFFYRLFPHNYYMKKFYNYKMRFFDNYSEIFFGKLEIVNLLSFFMVIISFIYLCYCIKKIKKDKEFYFLIVFGSFILSFFRISLVIFRFSWIFNIFFILFLLRQSKNKDLFFKIHYFLRNLIFILNLVGILYYAIIFYVKNYNSFPQIFYPTIMQIIGLDNKYNKKIKDIAIFYPQKYELGGSLMADLKKYYNEN